MFTQCDRLRHYCLNDIHLYTAYMLQLKISNPFNLGSLVPFPDKRRLKVNLILS